MATVSARKIRTVTRVEGLPDSHWKQFRDVRQPGRPDTKLDHVLVGPSGIHVIGYLSPTHPADEVAVGPLAEAARAVGDVLPERYRSRVDALVCFRNEEPMAEAVDGVTVTSFRALQHILRGSPVVLSTCEVTEIAGRLAARLQPFPVAPVVPRKRRTLLHAALAGAAAAALAVGAVLAGPEIVEAARLW
jgi:hypothetical protein